MLLRRITFAPLAAAAVLALAACDRAAVPADPSTGPIGEPTPTEESTSAPDPAPDLEAPPDGDPLPPEAFEGESIIVPGEEAAPPDIADEELQQRLDDAVTDAQRRAREIADEVLGGEPPDDPGTPAIEAPETAPEETPAPSGTSGAMAVPPGQPLAAAVLPEPALIEDDTFAASRADDPDLPFVGAWAGDAPGCGRVDQPGYDTFVVLTPDTARQGGEMCIVTDVAAREATATLQLTCAEGAEEVVRTASLEMADTEAMRFTGADGFGYDVVRCRPA